MIIPFSLCWLLTHPPRFERHLKNQARGIWACDFTVVYDWLFRTWCIFIVMELKTRWIVYTGVTKFPTDEWTAQQLREAIPCGKGPKYLIRDHDKKYATHFSAVAMSSGIKELKTPFRTPQANGYCERFMGSLRRECMEHILIHGVNHLREAVTEYTAYFKYISRRAKKHQRPWVNSINRSSKNDVETYVTVCE